MAYRTLAIALVYLSFSGAAQAGAWLQPQGQGLAIANVTYYGTSKYFDSAGELQKQPRFSKYELQPYVEYGLLDRLTVGGTAYAQTVSQSGNRNWGLADPEFFARTRLWNSETQVVSVQPFVKFGSHFTDDSPPRGGSKSTDYGLALLYSRNLHLLSEHDYVDSNVAYRTRSRGLSDMVQFDTALGVNVTEAIQLIPALRGTMAVSPTDAAVYSENGELDYSVFKAELTGIYHLNEQQWVQAGFFKHVAGVQTGDGYGMSLGFAQRF